MIATAADDGDGGRGNDEPAVVVSNFGKGRVGLLALGKDPSAMHEPGFIALFARTTEWAATLQKMVAKEVPVDEGLDQLAQSIDKQLQEAGLG